VFIQFGDLERVLLPVIARYRDPKVPKFFRGDAAFASMKLMKLLEAEGFRYAIRLKANAVLERNIVQLRKRPVGSPSKKPKVFYHSFRYRAKSWDRDRRVLAKLEWHAGELFPRVGFVVTNLKRNPKRVIKFYNGRGTAEQWIRDGKNAVKWTHTVTIPQLGKSPGASSTSPAGLSAPHLHSRHASKRFSQRPRCPKTAPQFVTARKKYSAGARFPPAPHLLG
jgi:hypothetical protein